MITKLSSYKIWALNPINNAACRCARQSDPPVRMGCPSAAAESGRALSAVLLYYAIRYCSIFFAVCQLFFKKMLLSVFSMLIIVIIEQVIEQLVNSRGIAECRLHKSTGILEHQPEIEPISHIIVLSR